MDGSVPPISSRRRLASLDALRGVAILLVLLYHLLELAPVRDGVPEWLRSFMQAGYTGVDLFFVLSGFLVSGLLFREYTRTGKIDIRRFLLRRGLKIWPSYYAFVAAIVAAVVIRDSSRAGRLDVSILGTTWLNLVFLQNYGDSFWVFGPTWSLAIEEHFYVLLSALLGAMVLSRRVAGRGGLDRIPMIALVICAGVMAARAVTFLSDPANARTWAMTQTHLRLDALMFGVFLSWVYHFSPQRFSRLRSWRGPLTLVSLAMLVPAILLPQGSRAMMVGGMTSCYLGYGGLLVAALLGEGQWINGRAGRVIGVATRCLGVIGVYSYTIYLLHYGLLSSIVLAGIHRIVEPLHLNAAGTALCWAAIMLTLAISAGVLFSHAVERPFLRLRERLPWLSEENQRTHQSAEQNETRRGSEPSSIANPSH